MAGQKLSQSLCNDGFGNKGSNIRMSWRSKPFLRESICIIITALQKLGTVPFFMPFHLIEEACTPRIESDCQQAIYSSYLVRSPTMGKQHHDKMGEHNPLSLHRSFVIHYPALAIELSVSRPTVLFLSPVCLPWFSEALPKKNNQKIGRRAWDMGLLKQRVSMKNYRWTNKIILILRRTVLCTCYVHCYRFKYILCPCVKYNNMPPNLCQ